MWHPVAVFSCTRGALETCGYQSLNWLSEKEATTVPGRGGRRKLTEAWSLIATVPDGIPATRHRYATDLTNEQWEMIRPLVERERVMGRPTVINLREVINALLHLARTGRQWRLLPTDFPNWNTA